MTLHRLAMSLILLSAAAAAQRWRIPLDQSAVEVWGRGSERPRVYFQEWLPGLFERTLRLGQPLGEGVQLEWIFTGPRGGVTVSIGRHGAVALQRYYDSHGLSAEQPPKARYPEREWSRLEVSSAKPVTRVTLELNHRLELVLRANGEPAAAQTCLIDLQRSQLLVKAPPDARGVIEGDLVVPAARQVALRLDPAGSHQTMLGFGGIVSAPAFRLLSDAGRLRWFRLLDEYNLKLHREYPNGSRLNREMSNFGDLAVAVPHYYGDNFPNGEISDFEYLRQARQAGSKVLFEFWQLPAWARENGKIAAPRRYVEAILGYVRESARRTGAPPEIVGVQNEIIQPGPVWREMVLQLRQALDREGFPQVRIHMPDASNLSVGIQSARTLKSMPEVWSRLDYAATHVYDFQSVLQRPDDYDAKIAEWRAVAGAKPFIASEFALNHSAWQSDSYRLALSMGQLFHKNLVSMDAIALLWCWTLLDVEQPSFAATRSLFEPDRANGFVPKATGPITRVFGAYSRKVREGMRRIDVQTQDGDILAVAFAAEEGQRTVVMLNRGVARVSVSGMHAFSRLERTSQYMAHHEEPCQAVVDVAPGEIVTAFN